MAETVTDSSEEQDLKLEVVSVDRTGDGDVVVLDLARRDGDLPPWQAGAHLDLFAGNGLIRQYSLAGDPAADVWTVGILRAPNSRGGSEWFFDHATPGLTLRGRGPRNHFPLQAAASYLFLAGGIGITPMLPMIAAAEARRADWRLVYGGRTSESMAFRDRLAPVGTNVDLWPQDERGLPPLDDLVRGSSPETQIYACGPEPMLEVVERAAQGVADDRLNFERFSPRDTGPVVNRPVLVHLARRGSSILVPASTSILSAVEAEGVHILSSCGDGTCGTCETAVLGGVPEHRDSILSPDERAANDCMMICVSRAHSDELTLDL